MKLRNYLPSIIVAVLVVTDGILKLIPTDSTLWSLLSPFFVLELPLDALIVLILKQLSPYNTSWWKAGDMLFTLPNFTGWLVASPIILIPVLALNYFLVIRKIHFRKDTLHSRILSNLFIFCLWFFGT